MSNKNSAGGKNSNQKDLENANQNPIRIKREELEALSDTELNERWREVFQVEGGPEVEREKVIEAILTHTPQPPAPTLATPEVDDKGDKEVIDSKGRKWTVKGDMKGRVVVVQANVDEFGGEMVEVPNTAMLQTYTPSTYERLTRENFFVESKMKVEVLQGA